MSHELSDRDEVTLQEAAEALGVSVDSLLRLLAAAGVQVGPAEAVRLQAADVLAIRQEREHRRRNSLRELARLSEELGAQEAERDPDDQ